MLVNPDRLTTAEALEVSRRRAGLTQREAADLAGMSYARYRRAENGTDASGCTPRPWVGELEPGEECRIMRGRASLTRAELEEVSGFKAAWIHKAETGEVDAAPLVRFWHDMARELGVI